MILCSLLDARRELTESHEITLVCLSVCPSARPSVRSSLSCSKTGSLVFLDIIHDDSWPWYQVAQISAKWAKIGSKTSFFAIFSILIHLLSLNLHTMIVFKFFFLKKILGPNLGKDAKIGRETTIIFIIFWDFMVFYQIFHSL